MKHQKEWENNFPRKSFSNRLGRPFCSFLAKTKFKPPWKNKCPVCGVEVKTPDLFKCYGEMYGFVVCSNGHPIALKAFTWSNSAATCDAMNHTWSDSSNITLTASWTTTGTSWN